MHKEHLIRLTSVLYKVTEELPEQEPLKFSIRQKAVEILADGVLIFTENPFDLTKEQKRAFLNNILQNVGVIQACFNIGQNQNWVAQENFAVLGKEYEQLKEQAQAMRNAIGNVVVSKIKKQDSVKTIEPKTKIDNIVNNNLKKRHQKIIDVLQNKGSAQVRDLKEVFPDLSKRTLRRDMDELLNLGVIRRMGDKNNTFYKLSVQG